MGHGSVRFGSDLFLLVIPGVEALSIFLRSLYVETVLEQRCVAGTPRRKTCKMSSHLTSGLSTYCAGPNNILQYKEHANRHRHHRILMVHGRALPAMLSWKKQASGQFKNTLHEDAPPDSGTSHQDLFTRNV